MKNTVLILFLSIFVFMLACNNDTDCPVIEPEPEPIEEPKVIQLNEPFIAKVGEKWHYEDDGDTFDISITGILDGREYGDGCAVSMGGSADIFIMEYKNHLKGGIKFNWQGCDGVNEYDVNNSNLPTSLLGTPGYAIRMMKMYPLSEIADVPPNDLNAFEIKLVLIN